MSPPQGLAELPAQHPSRSAQPGAGRCFWSTMAVKPAEVYVRPTAICRNCFCLNSILKGGKSVEKNVSLPLFIPSP